MSVETRPARKISRREVLKCLVYGAGDLGLLGLGVEVPRSMVTWRQANTAVGNFNSKQALVPPQVQSRLFEEAKSKIEENKSATRHAIIAGTVAVPGFVLLLYDIINGSSEKKYRE